MSSDSSKQQEFTLNDAIERAKEWVRSTYSGENISNVGLEEVERYGTNWAITIGFSRPWDTTRNALTMIGGEVATRRSFKVIQVDQETGEVKSMKNRAKD